MKSSARSFGRFCRSQFPRCIPSPRRTQRLGIPRGVFFCALHSALLIFCALRELSDRTGFFLRRKGRELRSLSDTQSHNLIWQLRLLIAVDQPTKLIKYSLNARHFPHHFMRDMFRLLFWNVLSLCFRSTEPCASTSSETMSSEVSLKSRSASRRGHSISGKNDWAMKRHR